MYAWTVDAWSARFERIESVRSDMAHGE